MQIYADTASDSTQASHVLEVQRKGKTNALRKKTLQRKKKTSELEEKTIPSKSGNNFLKKRSLKSSLFFSPCFTSREREEKA